MWFALAALVFMYVGRRIGWVFSRGVLYRAPIPLSILGTLIWGVLVGFAMSRLIGALHPNVWLKWILGFTLGAYVAIPNYGLFQDSSIPDSELPRHLIISNAPLLMYVATEFVTRSMRV